MLVDFWTYTCINCIRTLPYLKAWDSEYRDRGLTIVGVHAPEFAFEKETANVEDAIDDNDLEYPVIQDNELATWDAFQNQYWPAKYLIDADGHVRYVHFGEGAYEETETAIRSLLDEAGLRRPRQGRGGDRGRERRSRRSHPGDLPRLGARPGVRRAAAAPGHGHLRRARGRPGRQRLRPRRDAGRSTRSPRRRSTTRRSSWASRRDACSWCWAHPKTAAGEVEVLLDGKPISDSRRGRGRPRTGRRRSPTSGSTAWSSSTRPASTRSSCASSRASAATRSRSASAGLRALSSRL